jgi:hypothetical protein
MAEGAKLDSGTADAMPVDLLLGDQGPNRDG